MSYASQVSFKERWLFLVSGWRQVRSFQIFECWVRARGKYETFSTSWVRVGGKRVSLSGHHWIYPYMSDQRTGGGRFACKSNIRITLAYSSDMSTGIESSTYQLGMTQGNTSWVWPFLCQCQSGMGPEVTPGLLYLPYTREKSAFGPDTSTKLVYVSLLKKYPISIPARYEKNPQNLIPGPVCIGEGPIFRPFLDSRHPVTSR